MPSAKEAGNAHIAYINKEVTLTDRGNWSWKRGNVCESI